MKLHRMVFYKASGVGREIPRDMLRYDTAFVSDEHPGVVAFCQFKSKSGLNSGRPTEGRWRSFLIKLKLLSAEECQDIRVADYSKFYTYKHPMTGDITDYSEYEKVPLDRYLQAKDWTEVQVKK